jgi:PDZ domain-containing protein
VSHRQSTLAIVVAVSVVFALFFLPVPFVAMNPGPTFNTIGTYDGKEVITISGTKTYPTSGALSMVTVSESGGPYGYVSLGAAMNAWLRPASAVVPTKTLYPENVDKGQAVQEGTQAFTNSQNDAIAAAMNYLKIPVTNEVVVDVVVKGSPADGHYKVGDKIVAVDGKPVASADEAVKQIRTHNVGDEVTATVIRDGQTIEVTTSTRALSAQAPNTPSVGLSISDVVVPPFKITFSLSDVGGPSAGTMFSLGIVDELTPGYLNGGKAVAGTGTIDPQGNVGPIGGVVQKIAGAQRDGAKLFLLPTSNCGDLKRIPAGIVASPVSTLTQAVDVVKKWVAGDKVPSCPKQ